MTGVQTCALPICFPVTIGNVQPDIFANAVVVSFSADLDDEDCWIDDYESHEDSDLEYIQDEINALSSLTNK